VTEHAATGPVQANLETKRVQEYAMHGCGRKATHSVNQSRHPRLPPLLLLLLKLLLPHLGCARAAQRFP